MPARAAPPWPEHSDPRRWPTSSAGVPGADNSAVDVVVAAWLAAPACWQAAMDQAKVAASVAVLFMGASTSWTVLDAADASPARSG